MESGGKARCNELKLQHEELNTEVRTNFLIVWAVGYCSCAWGLRHLQQGETSRAVRNGQGQPVLFLGS